MFFNKGRFYYQNMKKVIENVYSKITFKILYAKITQ